MFNIEKRTQKRRLGDIGENIACDFLVKIGYEILERNYLRKWGEIDIVARKDGGIRFVEVKSLSVPYVTPSLGRKRGDKNVTYGTFRQLPHRLGEYRPEDNMHPAKLRRLARTMQTYMLHKKLDCPFQLDLITVKMDEKSRQARVEVLENIVI